MAECRKTILSMKILHNIIFMKNIHRRAEPNREREDCGLSVYSAVPFPDHEATQLTVLAMRSDSHYQPPRVRTMRHLANFAFPISLTQTRTDRAQDARGQPYPRLVFAVACNTMPRTSPDSGLSPAAANARRRATADPCPASAVCRRRRPGCISRCAR